MRDCLICGVAPPDTGPDHTPIVVQLDDFEGTPPPELVDDRHVTILACDQCRPHVETVRRRVGRIGMRALELLAWQYRLDNHERNLRWHWLRWHAPSLGDLVADALIALEKHAASAVSREVARIIGKPTKGGAS